MRKTITLTAAVAAEIPLWHSAVALTLSRVTVTVLGTGTLTGQVVGQTVSTACTAGMTDLVISDSAVDAGWITWQTTAVDGTITLAQLTLIYEEAA